MAATETVAEGPDRTQAGCQHSPACRIVGKPRYSPRRAELNCDQPLLVRRECGGVEYWFCRNHRESKCVPCAGAYLRAVQRVALSGSRASGYQYLLTLTAPGSGGCQPWCECLANVRDLGDWNPTAGQCWNRFRTALRVMHPTVEFFRAAEVQKRGAIHHHVLVWSQTPLDLPTSRRLAIRAGYGHSVDLAPLEPGSTKQAYYVAKYVTKAGGDDRDNVPWRADVTNEETGEIERLHTFATYRAWSASRGWGVTMKQLREDRCRGRLLSRGSARICDGTALVAATEPAKWAGCVPESAWERSGGAAVPPSPP